MTDPTNIHTQCLISACGNLNLEYQHLDDSGVFIEIYLKPKPLKFIANQTPYNSKIISDICQDKARTYDLLHQSIPMPKTIKYLDPHPPQKYLKPYTKHTSYKSIADDISRILEFPLITKPNHKSQGLNVFMCQSKTKIITAISNTFNKTPNYDYMLIAQPFINISKEYRVIVHDKKIILTYLKDTSNGTFTGNLSPLHWKNSKALIIQDQIFIKKMQSFINPIFNHLDLVYAGLDIIIDTQQKWWLLEINTSPGFNHLVDTNGTTSLINTYEKILKN